MEFENIRPEHIFRQMGTGQNLLIDLREPSEYKEGHIPGAIAISYENLKRSIPKLQQWKEQCMKKNEKATLIVYCDRGNTSLRAARDLYNQGFCVKNVYGGISAYRGPKVKES